VTVLESLRHAFALAREKSPGFTEEMSEEALQQILALLGGEQVNIPKTTRGRAGRPSTIPKHVEEAAYKDALCNTEPIDLIVSRHGISRRALYRLIKRGPRSAE